MPPASPDQVKPQGVPMYDEAMNPVMVNAKDVQHNLQAGFTLPTPEEISQYHNEKNYGSLGQQVITGVEGAAEAATFGGSTAVERALGVSPEGIQGRREANPISHGLGQTAGLIGTSLIGVGEGALLEKAGEAGARALAPAAAETFGTAKALQAAKSAGVGIEEAMQAHKAAQAAAPFLAKVGSSAANQAIQFGLMQSGDEVSKMFSGAPGYENPGTAAETALTNIGLSTLLGGAGGAVFTGAISPLWKATIGDRAENFLTALRSRANAETIPLAKGLEDVAQYTNIPPELRAGFSNNPMIKEHYENLINSGTHSGEALRSTLDKFKEDLGSNLQNMFRPEESMTAHEAGEKAKESILAKAEELNSQVGKQYEALNPHNEAIEIPDKDRLKFYDTLIKQGQEFGSKGSASEGLFKNYAERALAQDNLQQLDKLVTEIGSDGYVAYRAGDFEKSKALGDIKEAIRDFQESQIGKSAEKSALGAGDKTLEEAASIGKQFVEDRKAARSAYADFMEQMRDIASVGKLGKVKSFSHFQDALEKVPSAKFAEKLFDKKNIEGLNYLKENYPDILQDLISQKKQSMLEAATKGQDFQHNVLLNQFSKLPKEVKDLMFSQEEQKAIDSSYSLLRQSNKVQNPSGTTRAKEMISKHMPAGVGAAVSILTGHNPLVGYLIGEGAKFLGKDAPDAIKLSLLKFLGSTGPVDGEAWKVASDFINKTYKGQKLMSGAVQNIFKPGAEVLGSKYIPDDKIRNKLDERLKELKVNPSALLETGGKIGHYLPDQNQALAQTASNATNYLNSLRPDLDKKAPLDSEPKMNAVAKANYNRALDIAEQPLVVLPEIKDGSITQQDVMHLRSLYPALYTQISTQLTQTMIQHLHDDGEIPYKTRLGMALFLGQPLDSTMTPQSISAMNPPGGQTPTASQMQQMPSGGHHSMKNLGKIAQSSMTASQSREVSRNKA